MAASYKPELNFSQPPQGKGQKSEPDSTKGGKPEKPLLEERHMNYSPSIGHNTGIMILSWVFPFNLMIQETISLKFIKFASGYPFFHPPSAFPSLSSFLPPFLCSFFPSRSTYSRPQYTPANNILNSQSLKKKNYQKMNETGSLSKQM